MRIVLKNEFQFLNPLLALRLQVNIIEPDEEKLGNGFNFKCVAVLWHKQEQLFSCIRQFILVDALHARAVYNIHEFEEVMLVRVDGTFLHFQEFDLERLVQILDFHIPQMYKTFQGFYKF